MLEKQLYYFVSDAHLGSRIKGRKQEDNIFLSFIQNLPKETKALYLLGDIFDYWYEYKYVVPRGHTRFLGELAKLVDAGVEVHFFNGNHDIWTFDYLQTEIGVEVHDKPIVTEILDKKFYLAHGDGLGCFDRGYSFLQRVFKNKFIQKMFGAIHPRWSMALGYAWSKKSRLSKADKHRNMVNSDVRCLPIFSHIDLLNVIRMADYYIAGHYHRPDYYRFKEGGELFMLGDWPTHCDYLVFDGETLKREIYSTNQ